jgi:hypothetical protein
VGIGLILSYLAAGSSLEAMRVQGISLPTITLVTCYPFYFIGNAPKRYIVQAIAVEQSGKSSTMGAISTALPSGETP